jgi:hypothetical protein
MIQPDHSNNSVIIVVGYVRISSEMQKDNYSIDAQKRAIREAAKLRDLPEPTFFEDDERSARGEQIAKRPEFKRLLDYVQANPGKVIVFVHTLDRWSRNVMVTLQSFRILSLSRTAFISLSEHIDYSTPEGMLHVGKTINSPLLTYKIASSLSLIRRFVPSFFDSYLRPNLKLTHYLARKFLPQNGMKFLPRI